MKQPLVSAIIVNWNGKKWLKECLGSLNGQTYKDFEIVLVDNGSTDDSVKYVIKNYPKVRIVETGKNLGFASGNNAGIAEARGELLLLLNNDTWVEKEFIEELVGFYQENNFDVVAPTEVGPELKVDQVSNFSRKIDIFGHPINLKNSDKPPFFLSGVSLLFSKDLYEFSGGLDNDFFMYCEDVDWFWRLHIYGKTIAYAPNVYVHHYGTGSSDSGINSKVFLWRNQNTLQMLLKNYSAYNLLWVLPVYFVINVAEIIAFLFAIKPGISATYVLGWWFNIVNISKILKKRSLVQQNRVSKDREIMKLMYWWPAKLNHLVSRVRG